jgi:hypothetical protein
MREVVGALYDSRTVGWSTNYYLRTRCSEELDTVLKTLARDLSNGAGFVQ